MFGRGTKLAHSFGVERAPRLPADVAGGRLVTPFVTRLPGSRRWVLLPAHRPRAPQGEPCDHGRHRRSPGMAVRAAQIRAHDRISPERGSFANLLPFKMSTSRLVLA